MTSLTTATPSPTSVVVVIEGCTAPGVIITTPLAGAALTGIVEVRGTASIPDLASYRLEIRSAAQPIFTEVVRVTQPVVNDVLWRLDTDAYPAGIHYLRLIVLSRRGSSPQPCIIPVVFE